MGLRLGLGLICLSLGCGSSLESAAANGNTDGTDSGGNTAVDSSTPVDGKANPGIVDGGAPSIIYAVHAGTDDPKQPTNAQNVPSIRLCLDGSSTPLPNDFSHPMPLSNFPGIGVGSMSELGTLSGQYSVSILSAFGVNDSSSYRTATCDTILGDQQLAIDVPAQSKVVLTGGVQILVVTGAAQQRTLWHVFADSQVYQSNEPIHLQLGHFAPSVPTSLTAKFGPKGGAMEPMGQVMLGALAATYKPSSQAFPANPTPADFDTHGVQVGSAFYSLSAIAAATDPTTTPSAFFGSRLNGYALLLVDGAASTQHMVAVPLRP